MAQVAKVLSVKSSEFVNFKTSSSETAEKIAEIVVIEKAKAVIEVSPETESEKQKKATRTVYRVVSADSAVEGAEFIVDMTDWLIVESKKDLEISQEIFNVFIEGFEVENSDEDIEQDVESPDEE